MLVQHPPIHAMTAFSKTVESCTQNMASISASFMASYIGATERHRGHGGAHLPLLSWHGVLRPQKRSRHRLVKGTQHMLVARVSVPLLHACHPIRQTQAIVIARH